MNYFKKCVFYYAYLLISIINGIYAIVNTTIESEDFEKVVQSEYFIDKTLLIETVLNDARYIFLAGTRLSGKTVNINMMKRFFEAPRVLYGDLEKNIKQSNNYKLFTENNLKITRNSKIMEKHFGKYPVLWANLYVVLYSETREEVVEEGRAKIRESFLDHQYLENSDRLSEHEKKLFRQWCNESEFQIFNKSEVIESLTFLSQSLYRHYNKKCVVLIDDWDELLYEQFFAYEDDIHYTHVEFFKDMFYKLLHENRKYIERAVFTGKSFILMNPVLEKNKIKPRSTLRNEKYREFFGLLLPEVYDYFVRFNVSKEDRRKVYKFYKFQTYKNVTIFNIWSLKRFAHTQNFTTYWRFRCIVPWNMFKSLRNDHLRDAIESLVHNKTVSMRYRKLTDRNIDFINALLNNYHHKGYYNFWFSVWLDMGYFDIVNEEGGPEGSPKFEIRLIRFENINKNFGGELMEFYMVSNDTEKLNSTKEYLEGL